VDANKKAEKDSDFAERAKNFFSRLETGDQSLRRDWKLIRDLTISELEKVYGRLGIRVRTLPTKKTYFFGSDAASK
jgi:arginyl-tRNA synthetase